MRKILALILTMGLASGGCAWFGGSSSEEAKPAQPQEQVAAPEPAPAPEVPAKDVKGKGKTKAKTKAEKQAEAKPVASKKVVKTEAQIAAELTMVGNRLAAQAARTVMPSKSAKEVRQDGKDYVASYVDVDASNVTTELHPGATGQYVGYVRYQEKIMECRGKTKQEAITTASCQQVKARNLNELIRYDGSTWQY